MPSSWQEASTLILALRTRLPHTLKNVESFTGLHATSISSNPASDAVNSQTRLNQSSFSLSSDFLILMLKRSSVSSFMPSNVVFPGGLIQEVDYSREWSNIFKQVTGHCLDDVNRRFRLNYPQLPPILTCSRNWGVAADIAFRICAIRETFEESGLLIATKRGCPESEIGSNVSCKTSDLLVANASWRREVEQNPSNFLHMCRELNVVPNVWALSLWRNWMTSGFWQVLGHPRKPKRFDTVFYMCCIDCDNIPETLADESEITEAEWRNPVEFLTCDKRLPLFAPPQMYELHSLSKFLTLDSLRDECLKLSSVGLARWMPAYRLCHDGILMLLPGDYLYPENPDYEGTQDAPPSFTDSLLDLTDKSRNLNRIIFEHSALQSVFWKDSYANILNILKNGTVLCNI